ncbi:MAG: hypothetical protein O7I93_04960 [Gemmatimonadetes bacterium]|nr:hypothetical protein [Gemmatimonadota bacterium]
MTIKHRLAKLFGEDGSSSEAVDVDQEQRPEATPVEPSQDMLTSMLTGVTRARVLEDGVLDGSAMGMTVLLDTADKRSIRALRRCLEIVDDPRSFGHCMCLGDLAIELYDESELVATIGMHHGRSIRWHAWKHDALLQDGLALLGWLADRGVTGPKDQHESARRLSWEYEEAAGRWRQAMPQCLASFWPRMHEFDLDLDPMHQALEAAHPDRTTRILAVFEWFGAGKGPWSGYPSYESVPEQLLLGYATAELVVALTKTPPTAARLEGAARFFAGWEFRRKRKRELRQIPPALRQKLLEHALTSAGAGNRERAKAAFGDECFDV